MNRFRNRLLSLVCIPALLLCGASAETAAEPTELIVFAAASMTETLTAIKDLYDAEHPEIISRIMASSGPPPAGSLPAPLLRQKASHNLPA